MAYPELAQQSFTIITKQRLSSLRSPVATHWPVVLALILGAVVRLVALGTHSLLLDESFVAVGARDILRNHTPMWDAISNAPFVWMVAQLIGLHGLSNDALVRLPAALFGIASISAVYWLALRLFDRRIAGVSALLFALHPFAVAFNRILFADTFQVFFILVGWIAFDRLALDRTIRWRLLEVFLLWAAAFLMKYNAVVPGALWLVAGTVMGRYTVRAALVGFIAMTAGAIVTLLIWPYDAPVWLGAFLDKGGAYNIVWAAQYYFSKLHLVVFQATEVLLIAALLIAFRVKGREGRVIGQLVVFAVLNFITLVLLGRTFERYLLITVPIGCILLTMVVLEMWRVARALPEKILWRIASALIAVLFIVGTVQAYTAYFDYLSNDVDRTSLARSVLQLEQRGARGFWLISEPVGAYYLGFTQHYSRAVRGNLDGECARNNYFEWSAIPYSDEWTSYGVQEIRTMARRWGIKRILLHPFEFRDSAHIVRDVDNALPHAPAINYLTSDTVRTGDALIMQSGLMDIAGEPILEKISAESTPPFIRSLPLSRFNVYQCYRPSGLPSNTDTTLDPIRAGAWVLVRK